jgi:hypothetical protein
VGVTRKLLAALLLGALFIWIPARALAAPVEDEVVVGGTLTLEEGEEIDGSLIIFGGTVEVQQGARVTGNVILFGGELTLDGEVGGGVSQYSGTLSLSDDADIAGDVNTLGGTFNRDKGAVIGGSINTDPQSISFEDTRWHSRSAGALIMDGLWQLFLLFAFSALSVIIVLFWPRQVGTTASALVANPALAGGYGLLAAALAIPAVLLLAVTLILSPLALAGMVVMMLAALAGWTALGLEIGRRLAAALGRTWAPGLAAGAGTFLLGTVYLGMGAVPCLGDLVQFLLIMVSFGAAVITRFGTRPYPELAEA